LNTQDQLAREGKEAQLARFFGLSLRSPVRLLTLFWLPLTIEIFASEDSLSSSTIGFAEYSESREPGMTKTKTMTTNRRSDIID
jgi:hypothetical protein